MKTRIEHDPLGTREVPVEAYYGIHTLRAVENFPLLGQPSSLPIQHRTHVYLSGFSTLPRVFWSGRELLNYRAAFSPLWMHDTTRGTSFMQVSSACHFHYALAGQAVLEFRKFRFTLQPGQAFLVAGSEAFAFAPHGDSPRGCWDNIGIMINEGHQVELACEIMERHGPIFQLDDVHPAIQHLLQLIRGGADGAYPDAITLSADYESFLLSLCQFAAQAPTSATLPVTTLINYLHAHYHLPLTMQHLAEYASYSISQLSRHFLAHIGLTPMEYLTRLRLTFAMEALMGQPELTLPRAATMSGFSNRITLYKVTLRYLHCTPTVARQMDWDTLILRIWSTPPDWLPRHTTTTTSSGILTYPPILIHDVTWTGLTGCVATLPTPGLGSTLTGNSGWGHSYGMSTQSIPGDGWVSFQVASANLDTGTIGLCKNAAPNFSTGVNNVIDYAFYPYVGGNPYIQELTNQPKNGGSYSTSSILTCYSTKIFGSSVV